MSERRRNRGKELELRWGPGLIVKAAGGMIRDIDESLKIAKVTKNDETARSQIAVATEQLKALRKMEQAFRFLTVTGLEEKQVELLCLRDSRFGSEWVESAPNNARGRELEKAGDVAGALRVYERLAGEGAGTPHTYRRLAILHRKAGSRDDELRVLKMAIENIPKKNRQHRKWFRDRLAKLKARKRVS